MRERERENEERERNKKILIITVCIHDSMWIYVHLSDLPLLSSSFVFFNCFVSISPMSSTAKCPFVTVIDASARRSVVSKLIYELTGQRQPLSQQKIPFSMPISMNLKHLEYLSANKYWVSNKSDGERAMLWLTSHGDMYAVYRDASKLVRFNISALNVCKYLAVGGDTIFDVEDMGRELYGDNHHKFIILDVLVVNGKRTNSSEISTTMTTRFKIIEQIMVTYNMFLVEPKVPMAFSLNVKKWHLKEHIGDLFASEDVKEGAIFVPDAGSFILKWKRTSTIDLLIKWPFVSQKRKDGTQVSELFAGATMEVEDHALDVEAGSKVDAKGYVLVDRSEVKYLPIIELAKRGNDRKREREKIIECEYSNGYLRFVKVRTDKTEPNYITTVMATMKDMIDNITEERLTKECTYKQQADEREIEWIQENEEEKSEIV